MFYIFRTRESFYLILIITLLVSSLLIAACNNDVANEIPEEKNEQRNEVIKEEENSERVDLLPVEQLEEEFDLEVTLREAIEDRRSIRSYEEGEIKLEELAVILWSAQGITDEENKYRAAPSAGATYPMEVYVIAGEVEGLEKGIYRYGPIEHELIRIAKGDFREDLMAAALNQEPIRDGAMNIVITSVYERVMGVYGERGIRYAKIEAGHISQNIYLKSTALNLGTVSIGAFEDEQIAEILNLAEGEEPLYIMPVGRQ